MEFLDKLVLPQSAEHLMLLHYLLIVTMFLFIPFVSVVFGGAAVSLYFRRKGISTGNSLYLRYAKDIIETLTLTKSSGIALGILPLLTAMLISVQLLHTSNIATDAFLFAAFLLITTGLILVYIFRYSQSFSELFQTMKDFKSTSNELNEIITKFSRSNTSLGAKSGGWGLIFLFLAIWTFITGITAATFSEVWGSAGAFSMLFSWQVLARVLFFIAAAFALTGASIFFSFFYLGGRKKIKNEEYKELVKNNALTITFAGAIILPIFLIINIYALPAYVLSKAVFAYALGALLLTFVVYHLLYGIGKLKSFNLSGSLFFVMMFAILSFIVQDQLALANATKQQSLVLSSQYDTYITALKVESAPAVAVSGEDVYKRICSACHQFDAKLVGPSYNETLPKYEGKVDQLVAFIRNPSKVNPAYPPMPNPGIRPDEAKAVAEYILSTYKK
ncbi:MAG: c-type cytochrome [Ignavibacteriaceae bacterium]|nr:c-type cytochrome [Ignavibacteriaceae bacterium]